MDDVSALLRLLGDDVRLRMLRLVDSEGLNISELTGILGIAQSGVSRHVGLLRDAGLVVEARVGGFTRLRLAPDSADRTGPRAALWTWLKGEFARGSAVTRADDAKLQEVRRLRKESFVTHGADDERGQLVPGRSWAAWSRALGLLLPPLDVADLGCGEGYLTIETARWARSVVAIDRSPDVLARARALAKRRHVRNIVWKRGALEHVPLDDRSMDLVLFSQALHHADQPIDALREAARILRPGGRVLFLELRAHQEAWVRDTLGDRWLGFTEDQLREWLAEAGFSHVSLRVGARTAGDPFVVLVGAATRGATSPGSLVAPPMRRRRSRALPSPRTSA